MDKNKEWEGYTLDELRSRQLINLAKIEVCKTMLMSKTQQMSQGKALYGSIWGKLARSLDYMDYALLAFKVGKKIYSLIKKK